MPRPSSRSPVFVPQTDGEPRRPWSSLNVRAGEKRKFDLLHQWWEIEAGRDLTQWDAFSILLSKFLERDVELPREMRLLLRDG